MHDSEMQPTGLEKTVVGNRVQARVRRMPRSPALTSCKLIDRLECAERQLLSGESVVREPARAIALLAVREQVRPVH